MTERLISDIGGLPAGDVPREEVPQLFWEKHMIAMFNVLSGRGIYNLDEFRRKVEEMPLEEYKHSTFYGRRLDAIAGLLIEKGYINREDLDGRTAEVLRRGTRDHVP